MMTIRQKASRMTTGLHAWSECRASSRTAVGAYVSKIRDQLQDKTVIEPLPPSITVVGRPAPSAPSRRQRCPHTRSGRVRCDDAADRHPVPRPQRSAPAEAGRMRGPESGEGCPAAFRPPSPGVAPTLRRLPDRLRPGGPRWTHLRKP
jgi:hypothetical protein